MSICVKLEVKQRPILIVGGGKVALRKAKLFLREGAIVKVVAPKIEEELYALAECATRVYQTADLQDVFLVVAASDDLLLNARIREEAKQHQILYMGVRKEQEADLRAMSYVETAEYTLAVSTNGNYPLLAKQMVKDMQTQIEMTTAKRLCSLKHLRNALLKCEVLEAEKQQLLQWMSQLDNPCLAFLQDALTKQQAIILIYHGVKDTASREDIQTFVQTLSKQATTCAFGYAFLSERILETVNTQMMQVFPCAMLFHFLQVFHIKTKVIPMFLQNGRFHTQLQKLVKAHDFYLAPLPYADEQSLAALFTYLHQQYYRDGKELYIVFHSCLDKHFWQLCEHQAQQLQHTHCCYEKAVPDITEDMVLCPLFMLCGKHASACNTKRISCMSDPWIRHQLKTYVMDIFQENWEL